MQAADATTLTKALQNRHQMSEIEAIEIENEVFFRIKNHDTMRPFLMNIVSDSNHWMFISSNGGLTAGRKNPEFALFPYYTDDKLTEFANITGSKTVFQISSNEQLVIWEPFVEMHSVTFNVTRNLYKNKYGNKVIFEEENHDLGLVFRYQWNSSNLFGFIKKAELINKTDKNYSISALDGIQNIMPHGVSSALQTTTSNLVDAYKRNELEPKSGLGIFALSAYIVDKAEPGESLKANIAWSLGLGRPTYLVSSLQLNNFRLGQKVAQEEDVKGEKGAYFINTEFELKGFSSEKWLIAANVNQDQSQIVSVCEKIKNEKQFIDEIEADIKLGTFNLTQLVAAADGLQFTSDNLKDTRHFSNVLFNIMRGGIFDDNYQIEKNDFTQYLENANKVVCQNNQSFIQSLPTNFSIFELHKLLNNTNNLYLNRLAKEYLPLKFSRRHGDPSRPWNKFSINTRSEIDGSKILDYEGNWRDIFQNWEALVHSYPQFIESMICKFLNASTFDGYNPYRVTKGGFDWETIEPDNPWSYIGYWGDHQIIYLLKFLEFAQNQNSKLIDQLSEKNSFVYANVPYRIKTYESILQDPKNTIEFNEKLDENIRLEVKEIGADGALLKNAFNKIHHVSFLEKILATVLSKTSNFIPEAGIWMNTQRPEWNDANNALVGNGVSMVTLCYLRRFLKFFENLLENSALEQVEVSTELATLLSELTKVLAENQFLLSSKMDNTKRKKIVDKLGKAGCNYRTQIYNDGFVGTLESINISEIKKFVQIALFFFEHTIDANRRNDNLFHAYNLIEVNQNEISIDYLSEMLEGQVAVISSMYLDSDKIVQVLDALRNSALYREDQNSYLLYPNKDLPRFLAKNNVPIVHVEKSKLLLKMVADNNSQIISKDINGEFHFNGNFKNATDLQLALNNLKLSPTYSELAENDEAIVLNIFEQIFNHKAFTGRSGTFFAYEGLGSIYWHMVSKLHLAVQEACTTAIKQNANANTVGKLIAHFKEIDLGIGVYKSPNLYGAFPTDPYSHTPMHRGAQQPGMTGQVKEDILVRFAELGVFVENGQIYFDPSLLSKKALVHSGKKITYIDSQNQTKEADLAPNSICFTRYQVPIFYHLSDFEKVEVVLSNKTTTTINGLQLDKEISNALFNKTGEVKELHVFLIESRLIA